MDEFLIFFKQIGTTSDGKLIYQLDFSTDPDSAWGEDWAEIAGIVPNLDADNGVISSSYKIVTDMEFSTMRGNNCFTMQDCIDDIVPLAYHLDGDDTLIFRYSNGLDDVLMTLDEYGIEYEQLERAVEDDDSAIGGLIGTLNNIDSDFGNE